MISKFARAYNSSKMYRELKLRGAILEVTPGVNLKLYFILAINTTGK